MNPYLLFSIVSFRKELTFILLTFLLILLMPIFAVIVITKVGVDEVSNRLVEYDEVTNTVLLKDPKDGSVYKELTGTFVWPVKGVITLEFGESSLFQRFHTGIDIANPKGQKGDPITPFMAGKVIHTGYKLIGYGKHVIIDHGDNLTSIYAHLNEVYVKKDDLIKPGDVLGTQGSTGWSTGNHLHFEIRVFGVPVNPRVFLSDPNFTMVYVI